MQLMFRIKDTKTPHCLLPIWSEVIHTESVFSKPGGSLVASAAWLNHTSPQPCIPTCVQASKGQGCLQVPFTSQGSGICDPTNTTGSPPWWVPLPYVSNTLATQDWTTQLHKCNEEEAITVSSGTNWVKLNAGQYGFYRVNYTEPMWAQLATAVGVSSGGGDTVLGSEDVAGLLDDAYQLSRAGQLSITVFLNLIRCVVTHPVVL